MTHENYEQQIKNLSEECIQLARNNRQLAKENEILLEFIKSLGIHIEKNTGVYEDYKEGWVSFTKITIPNQQFITPFTTKEDIEWWKDQLDKGFLVRLDRLSHKPHIRVDFKDRDRFEVDYFNKRVEYGSTPSQVAEELGLSYMGRD